MKKKALQRFFGLAMASMLAVVSLAGCGNAEGSKGKADGTKKEASGEKKIIKFAHMFAEGEGATAAMGEAYQWVLKAVEKFEKENPEYEVQLEYIPGNDFSTKILTDHEAGIQHDIVMYQSTYGKLYEKQGVMYDISDYFKTWSKEGQDDFTWNPTWSSYELDGKLYALPLGLHTRTIAYNKEMFKAAGLDPEVPPRNYDELIEYAKKLTTDDVWGLGIYMGPHPASTETFIMPDVWSRGGSIFDEDAQKATFNTPEVRDTIQFMYDCIYKYKVTPTWTLEGEQDESLLKPFLNGQFAMAYGIGNYWLSDLQSAGLIEGAYPATADVQSKIGWFTMPAENGKTFANSWGAGVSADTTDPEAAFKLLTCMCDAELMKGFVSFGGFPGRMSSFSTDDYEGEFWEMWRNVADTGETVSCENFSSLIESMSQAMQEIVATQNEDGIEETLQRYQDEYNNRYGGGQ